MSDTLPRADPFVAFRFKIQVEGLSVGGFSECSGLQLETETHDYPEGGENSYIHRFPTRTKQTNLTLKRGIVGRELWDWYYWVVQGGILLRNGTVLLLDPSGSRVEMIWEFMRAFPAKWIGPELNASQSSLAVETFELCHQGLERIPLPERN